MVVSKNRPSGEGETRRIANPLCTDAISVWASMNAEISDFKEFRVSQQAVLQNDAGKVLILHEPINGNWLLPGGRIDKKDASIQSALHREILEELGIEIQIGRPVAVDTTRDGSGYAVAFLATTTELASIRISTEHDEYRWVPPTELENYLYYKNIATAIAEQLG